MITDPNLISKLKEFSQWKTINDTIMGGSSKAVCKVTSDGLSFKGVVVEEDGGFVSCLSPLFCPPLNLSEFKGIQLELDGDGRTLKFALSCDDKFSRFTEAFTGGVKWVEKIKTKENELISIKIPFKDLIPSIRAKPIPMPLKCNPTSIVQFQLLHSKFGTTGNLNKGFKPGPFSILLRSISAYI